MRIGLTYDLRDDFPTQGLADDEAAECESQETVQAIADTIASLGHDVDRIGHLKKLAARLVAGERWDLVFNLAEGTSGLSRESQVPALLDAYDIHYTFSDPLTLGLSLHKGMAKRVVRDCGVATPPFVVVENVRDLRALSLPFPVFAKPVAEGSSKGISGRSIAETPEALAAICETLLESYQQPVLVEEYLPGREFTVGIVGSGARARSLGAMEISLTDLAEPGVYSRHNKIHYKGRVSYSLVEPRVQDDAAAVALAAWHALGCRDGGRVDLRCDRHGVINFMEVNPLPGLDPITGDLVVLCRLHDIPYPTLLQMIVESAYERLATSRQASPAATDGHADVVRS